MEIHNRRILCSFAGHRLFCGDARPSDPPPPDPPLVARWCHRAHVILFYSNDLVSE